MHTYLRIKGIGIDLKFPGNAKPEDANLLISGYLAMRSGLDQNGNAIPNSDVYAGAVALGIKMGGAQIVGRPK